jgi:anti-sigma factor RsiW
MGANPIELVCQEVVELVTAYLSHALAPGERVRFEKHLLTCPPCTEYLAQMKTTIELAGGIGQAPAAGEGKGEAPEDLLGLFRRWQQK